MKLTKNNWFRGAMIVGAILVSVYFVDNMEEIISYESRQGIEFFLAIIGFLYLVNMTVELIRDEMYKTRKEKEAKEELKKIN